METKGFPEVFFCTFSAEYILTMKSLDKCIWIAKSKDFEAANLNFVVVDFIYRNNSLFSAKYLLFHYLWWLLVKKCHEVFPREREKYERACSVHSVREWVNGMADDDKETQKRVLKSKSSFSNIFFEKSRKDFNAYAHNIDRCRDIFILDMVSERHARSRHSCRHAGKLTSKSLVVVTAPTAISRRMNARYGLFLRDRKQGLLKINWRQIFLDQARFFHTEV
jgi:hypothetical protein